MASRCQTYETAKSRGRNAGWWTFIAIFVTPLICLAFISVLGETEEKREERLVAEELLKIKIRNELENE